jgi:glycosyltransferase involved in cell wall biosynthesis
VGPLHGQDKRDAFAAADLFVLPTHSEGSPMVVLEALGAGVPVLTTKGAPWADLVRHGCGWWTDISAGGIHDALRDALALSGTAWAAAGQRGRYLVAQKYSWAEIASKTIRLYGWLEGRVPTPDFVHFL